MGLKCINGQEFGRSQVKKGDRVFPNSFRGTTALSKNNKSRNRSTLQRKLQHPRSLPKLSTCLKISTQPNQQKALSCRTAKGMPSGVFTIYVMEIMRKDGVLAAITEERPLDTTSTSIINRFNEIDEKARERIVLNLGEELATFVTSLLMSEATTPAARDKL